MHTKLAIILLCTMTVSSGALAWSSSVTYPIVDTMQDHCYNNMFMIDFPETGQAFSGQDAQYQGNAASYQDNGNGTVTDLITGLTWQKTPDLKNKSTFEQAVAGAADCRLAGYTDWRLPTIKELYSLIDFRGYSMASAAASVPYINTDYFDFAYGDTTGGRVIDAQYWSSTVYVGTTMRGMATTFGVNFADGRIKGYGQTGRNGQPMREFVRYVRGNPQYGKNDFIDNGDGTITDRATGLMWMKADSDKTMNWQDALAYADHLEAAGYSDWRLPNAKELQSIVDYTRSPGAQGTAYGPAIEPIFDLTESQSWYWTSTTHLEHGTASAAVYLAFGQAFGYMGPQGHKMKMDVHGAGAQRSDPKSGDPALYPFGRGPQGDEIRITNYVRCVRGGTATPVATAPAIDRTGYPYSLEPATASQGGRFMAGGMPSGTPAHHPDFIRRLDKDSDGKVSRAEFDGPPAQFSHFDRDGDGYIGADEAPKGPPPPRH